MKNLNTPNKLTIARVVLVPVFFVCLMYWNRYVALIVFMLASMTDYLDGYLARKNNEITNLGKFMDPLADKLLVTTALICFVELGQLPAWVTIIVVGRDLAVDGLRMMAASRSIVMAAGWSGKVKTAVTMLCICLMITPLGEFEALNISCAVLILALNLISLYDYFSKNWRLLLDDE